MYHGTHSSFSAETFPYSTLQHDNDYRMQQQEQQDWTPERHPSTSVDHPEFTHPRWGRINHTENYYEVSDVASLCQKGIRRCDWDLTSFGFAMLLRTGFVQKSFDILATSACEDVGTGCLDAFSFVQGQYAKWKRLVNMNKKQLDASVSKHPEPRDQMVEDTKGNNTNKEKKESKKSVSVVAMQMSEAVSIFFETLLVLIQVPKSRAVACASGASIGYAEKLLRKGFTSAKNRKWTPEQCLQEWLSVIENLAAPTPAQEAANEYKKRDVVELRKKLLAWTHIVWILSSCVQRIDKGTCKEFYARAVKGLAEVLGFDFSATGRSKKKKKQSKKKKPPTKEQEDAVPEARGRWMYFLLLLSSIVLSLVAFSQTSPIYIKRACVA